MSSRYGKNFRINIFGESHGQAIGVVIEGLPGGIKLDLDNISDELLKRRPKSIISTSRVEKDEFEIVSGFFNEHTTGTPLTFIIKNKDVKSKDYSKIKDVARPSHADYTGFIKYNGYNDYRGGGHFSGRVTAPLVIAGAIAKQILLKKGIEVESFIKQIGELKYKSSKSVNMDEIVQYVKRIKDEGDSVGGVINTSIYNIETGYGEPMFNSIESKISSIIFSIPGVKAIGFGAGNDFSFLKGSEANDQFTIENDRVITKTNNSGGINGGISNGMPITFDTTIKAVSSIMKEQETIDFRNMNKEVINVTGRHDATIVNRVIPVIDAAAAIAIIDLIMEEDGKRWMI